jgi:predicted amidophosphoribosyltransferase
MTSPGREVLDDGLAAAIATAARFDGTSDTIRAVQTGGVLTAATEALLPGLCPHCDQQLPGGDRGLCATCWASMVPRAGTACRQCGTPTDEGTEECLQCVGKPPPQRATVIWGEHDGVLRTVVVSLKHRGHDDFARPLGVRLAAAISAQPWSRTIDVVSFVPSHPLRRMRRPWTASELLATEVARGLEIPSQKLLRRHGMRRQTGHSRAHRLRLPAGSFSAARRARGLCVLLIDDVTTTGTTIRRAAHALVRAGAKHVYCAVAAHAPDPRRIP